MGENSLNLKATVRIDRSGRGGRDLSDGGKAAAPKEKREGNGSSGVAPAAGGSTGKSGRKRGADQIAFKLPAKRASQSAAIVAFKKSLLEVLQKMAHS
jgi:hypothetical protein